MVLGRGRLMVAVRIHGDNDGRVGVAVVSAVGVSQCHDVTRFA